MPDSPSKAQHAICQNCQHWVDESSFWDRPVRVGSCRRNPPTPVRGLFGRGQFTFPRTAESDWCGEFSEPN